MTNTQLTQLAKQKASKTRQPAIVKYLETLISEKGVDLDTEINLEGNFNFTYRALIEAIAIRKIYHAQIKKRLLYIDFKNGDLFHFLKFIAVGITSGEM